MITRRHFINSISGLTAARFGEWPLQQISGHGDAFRAVLFDAFPIFDPKPAFNLLSELFPLKGTELAKEWRTRQFEYTWLRAAAGRYKNFWDVTEDALVYAADVVHVPLTLPLRKRIMSAYLSLDVWPDVLPALEILKGRGYKLGFLSNMTAEMLTACMKHSGTDSFFDMVLSTDLAGTYKPDSRAYRLGIDHLRLKPHEILYVPYAGWDAAGGKWFGYPTFWVNRLQAPQEELNTVADGSGKSMTDLISFLSPKSEYIRE